MRRLAVEGVELETEFVVRCDDEIFYEPALAPLNYRLALVSADGASEEPLSADWSESPELRVKLKSEGVPIDESGQSHRVQLIVYVANRLLASRAYPVSVIVYRPPPANLTDDGAVYYVDSTQDGTVYSDALPATRGGSY